MKMKIMRRSVLAAVLFTSVAAAGLAPAFAQTAPANTTAAQSTAAQSTAAQSQAHQHGKAWMTPGQLVDGRVAFLKAELKITPAQEAQWQQFAAAMRQNAQSLDQAIANVRQHRGTAQNAVERMEVRGQFAQTRAENQARLLTAFKPLYASLSPDQQQVANVLMTPHAGGHHGWRHRA
jgi:periplasmic protein CpxP/Spy